MAIGLTEGLFSNFFQLTAPQVQISDKITRVLQTAMRDSAATRIDLDSALPPADPPQRVRTVGIGSQFDLTG